MRTSVRPRVRRGPRAARGCASVGAVRGDHYFTATPASPDERRRIRVRLRGAEVEVETAPGTFSPEHLDTGTRTLLDAVDDPPASGAALDLGCGWGPLAIALAHAAPELDVWAVDVNERALDLARRNAAALGLDRIHAARPDDVDDAVRFDTIWSNPPIRIGKQALHELLEAWLPRLAPGGTAWLVVAKQLGADSLQRWLAERFEGLEVGRHSTEKGFRVLSAHRPG